MKELRIKVNKKEQITSMAQSLIEKFDIKDVRAVDVVVVKFFHEED